MDKQRYIEEVFTPTITITPSILYFFNSTIPDLYLIQLPAPSSVVHGYVISRLNEAWINQNSVLQNDREISYNPRPRWYEATHNVLHG